MFRERDKKNKKKTHFIEKQTRTKIEPRIILITAHDIIKNVSTLSVSTIIIENSNQPNINISNANSMMYLVERLHALSISHQMIKASLNYV